MAIEYVDVSRDNMTYHYPIEAIRVVATDGYGADVAVEFPSYSISGCRIDMSVLSKLLARRLMGHRIRLRPENPLLVWMGDGPLCGPEEECARQTLRLWWRAEQQTH